MRQVMKKGLVGAVSGALLLGAAGAGAAGLEIRPDGGTGATNLYGADSALDSFNPIAGYSGSSTNVLGVGSGSWPISVSFGADGLTNGDTFTESFLISWNIYCGTLGLGGQCSGLGATGVNTVGTSDFSPPTDAYDTHISTVLTLSGKIENVVLGADPTDWLDDEFNFVYTSATLDFLFDSDGSSDPTDASPGTKFAVFQGTGSSTTFEASGVNKDRADLSWNTTLTDALAGYFRFNGAELTDGGAGLRPVTDPLVFQFTQQDVIRDTCDTTKSDTTCFLTSDGPSTASATLTVPEPGTLGLLGLGLLGLGAAARRRARG